MIRRPAITHFTYVVLSSKVRIKHVINFSSRIISRFHFIIIWHLTSDLEISELHVGIRFLSQSNTIFESFYFWQYTTWMSSNLHNPFIIIKRSRCFNSYNIENFLLWRIHPLVRADSVNNSRCYGAPAAYACAVTSHNNRRGDAGGVFCRSAPRLYNAEFQVSSQSEVQRSTRKKMICEVGRLAIALQFVVIKRDCKRRC
jgi:hypothetical protein